MGSNDLAELGVCGGREGSHGDILSSVAVARGFPRLVNGQRAARTSTCGGRLLLARNRSKSGSGGLGVALFTVSSSLRVN